MAAGFNWQPPFQRNLIFKRKKPGLLDRVFYFKQHLERLPLGWNHPSDKNSPSIQKVEHVLIAKPRTHLRNLL